jgi:hypothetical protein
VLDSSGLEQGPRACSSEQQWACCWNRNRPESGSLRTDAKANLLLCIELHELCLAKLRVGFHWPQTVQTLISFVRFEVLSAVTMKNAVFWDGMLCRRCVNRRFGGMIRLHLQGRRQEEIREGISLSKRNGLYIKYCRLSRLCSYA